MYNSRDTPLIKATVSYRIDLTTAVCLASQLFLVVVGVGPRLSTDANRCDSLQLKRNLFTSLIVLYSVRKFACGF